MHEKLGTAGFIISVVALVAALSGGAYAASGGLTGKQKTEVEKIAKRFAGKPGAPGTAGPAGAAGPSGAKGDAGVNGGAGASGSQGSQGPQGPAGSPWTAGGIIPSGTTVTGTWTATIAGESGNSAIANISFPLPVKEKVVGKSWVFTPWEIEHNQMGKEEVGPNFYEPCEIAVGNPTCIDTGCNGNTVNPTAPAKTLCVYGIVEKSNLPPENRQLLTSITGGFDEEQQNGYGQFGTAIFPKAAAVTPTSYYDAYGVWVLNAP